MTNPGTYDFRSMTLGQLRAALRAPTGDFFARPIAGELVQHFEDMDRELNATEEGC
jgi:hypothetical protein